MLCLTVGLSLGAAITTGIENRRHLSTQQILRYSPTTAVTDHANIDLDQAAMEAEFLTAFPMAASKSIYETGTHSKPYAACTLNQTLAAAVTTKSPTVVIGYTGVSSGYLTTKAKANKAAGDASVDILYPVSETNPQANGCYDTSYITAKTTTKSTVGCLTANTDITIGGDDYQCTAVTNKAGRTLKGFSTAAKSKMYDPTMSSKDCPASDATKGYKFGCPYTSYEPYYDYYCASGSSCDDDGGYANDLITAAFDGTKTTLSNFAPDFSTGAGKLAKVRMQVIKKGTAYLSSWMYAIREFEDAIDDCTVGDLTGNAASSGPVHAWDEGVAFYAGSLMVPGDLYGTELAKLTKKGKLAYTLANKRCENFKTCGANGDAAKGEAKVNIDLFKLFRRGQEEILIGNCAGVVPIKDDIVKVMTIPLIQGTLRYAYKCDKTATCSSDAAGEATIFLAGVLPQLHACDPAAAKEVADMVNINGFTCADDSSCKSTIDFNKVKANFEKCYDKMGVTCTDIGGLWDDTLSKYYSTNGDASPCLDNFPPPTAPPPAPTPVIEAMPTWAIAIIAVLAALFVFVGLGFCYIVQMEKAGKPIFIKTMVGGAKA